MSNRRLVSKVLLIALLLSFVLSSTWGLGFGVTKVYAEPLTVDNPGFEDGNLTGWTVVEGTAFGSNSVSDDTTWWAEQIPYEQDGTYHLNGWEYAESATGILRSSTFTLGGKGWITFKMGGGKHSDLIHIDIYNADTEELVASYGNSEFADVNFPNINQGMRLANMVQYKAKLSEYLGQDLYIEIVDNATSDWGVVFADSFHTYHTTPPSSSVMAINLVETTPNTVKNAGFETGDMTGWTIIDGTAFGSNSVSDDTTWWAEQIPFEQDGTYHLNGWKNAESATGRVRSSTFELDGTGWITFKMGGGKRSDLMHLDIYNADTKELLAKYGNSEFADINFPNINQGMRLANMVQYKADLTAYIGEKLFIEIVDNATSDWGILFADSFLTYHESAPSGVAAINLYDATPKTIKNPNFEKGDFAGWTVEGTAFAVSDADTYGVEQYSFNQVGDYHVWGFAGPNQEAGTGKLTSSTFKLSGNGEINFLIAGASDIEDLYVALVKESDDSILFQETGPALAQLEGYVRKTWDVADYIGEKVRIEVVDNSTTEHINVDDFQVYQIGGVVEWSFDDGTGKTALDSVGDKEDDINHVFNQARYKEPTDPLWRTNGVEGGSLMLDGYSNWIIRDNEKVEQLTDALTIEAWVAPRAYEWGDQSKLSAIVNQYNEETREGYILGMYRHGSWSMQVGVGGQWVEAWVTEHPLEKFKWNHIVATFDKEDSVIKLYLNGEEVASEVTPEGYPITRSSEDLVIGLNNQAFEMVGVFHTNVFCGLIDEVKILNKALSAQEVADAYGYYLDINDDEIPEISAADIDLDPSLYDGDLHRPQYHLMPPGNWTNEAHAPFFYNGKYHLFYQHNPIGPYWHQIHWGHWVSEDMVHWENVRPALAPEAGTLDPDGAWSGSATIDENGAPVIFYTAGNNSVSPDQRTAIATPADLNDPYLKEWVKYPTPVTLQEDGGIFGEFRDPYVWYDSDTEKYYQLVSTGMEDLSSGTAFVYESDDKINWDYKGPIYLSDRALYPELGTVWELAVLLPLGKDSQNNDKFIFIVNPHEKESHTGSPYLQRDVEVMYWLGTWDRDNYRFIPDQAAPTRIDVGDSLLTAECGFIAPDGRVIMFNMFQGGRTSQSEYESGWAHHAALPVTLSLDANDELKVEPIEELQSLRGDKIVDFTNKTKAEANDLIDEVQSDMLEIKMEIDPLSADKFGLKVRVSPNEEEETLIYYDLTNETFNVDRTNSSVDPDVRSYGIQGGYVDLDGEDLILHIFLDRSAVEAFANYKKKLSTRVYVGRYDSLGLKVWSDSAITVKSMEIWEMESPMGNGDVVPVYVPDDWDNTVYNDITELTNHDFAAGDLTGWTVVSGSAFSNGHVTDQQYWNPVHIDIHHFNASQRIPGDNHLWGFKDSAGGDSLTGVLKSQNFTLGGNGKIDFLTSGGRDIDKLYVALVRVSDGVELFKQTGFNYEVYQRIVWDASAYVGQELYVKVVDNSTGGFGHINLDDVNIPVQVP